MTVNAAELRGTVSHVRDGDTIEVENIPIRLNGVSAPELNKPLGPQSKSFMVDLVLGKSIRCELNEDRTHDRWVGICYLEGKEIGEAVINAGWALDCPRFSRGRYQMIETREARQRIKLAGYCQ
jgi:micrococcal nuclease